jgi:putative methylase
MDIRSKKDLAIRLSKLKTFSSPKVLLEQYPTDSEIAADFLWYAYQKGDIKGKTIADLGAGTGILGIGCLLLDAKKVFFVDIDHNAIKTLKENICDFPKKRYEILNIDINDFGKKADVVVQNPPFGTKQEHADKIFLEKAFSVSGLIYSMHKLTSDNFIESISGEYCFKVAEVLKYSFPLKSTMSFHKKRIERIEVGIYRLIKK